MSFYNKQKNPFPFYELEGDVWTNTKPKWHKNNCNGCCYEHKVLVGNHYFQLPVNNEILSYSEVNSIQLRKVSDNVVIEDLEFQATVISDSQGNKYLSIRLNIIQDYVGDEYYLAVSTEYGSYYSETFCVSQLNKDYIGIEWASTNGKVGEMVYLNDFKHSINIEAKIVSSEPEIEEETEEDGFGNEVPTLQILKQGHELSFVVPNFIAQALSAIPLHDKINFINRRIGEITQELEVKNKYVELKITPEKDGCNSYIEINFIDELIVSTSCKEEITAFNNPPIVDIVWDDTGTQESRSCNTEEGCTETLRKSDLTMDPDGNLDSIIWQKKLPGSTIWTDLESGDTIDIEETDTGTYQYRLKAIDTEGLIGYSNILAYRVLTLSESTSPQIIELDSYVSQCSSSGGTVKTFDISAASNQTVRGKIQVVAYYGSGFVLKIFDNTTGNELNELFNWDGGPIGAETHFDFVLDSSGMGKYRMELCLNECGAAGYYTGAIKMNLLDVDNISEIDQELTLSRYFNCQ